MKTGTLRHISLITALAVLFFTAIALSAPVRSTAAQSAEKGFILIESKVGEEPVSGINWKVYAIGERRDTGGFILNEAFAESGVKLEDMSADAVKTDAETLCSYISENALQPDNEELSDESGAAEVFAQNAGIYLICSDETEIGGYKYRSSPAIVELKKDSGSVVLPKIEKETIEDSSSGSDDSEHDTPDSDSSSDDSSDSDTPESESSVSDSSRGTGGGSDNTPGDKGQKGGSSEKLPQTGQLWWPVPVLAVLGLALIALGLRVSLKKDGRDD